MTQMQQQFHAIQEERDQFKGAYDYVQDMLNKGELELDEHRQVLPPSSKSKS